MQDKWTPLELLKWTTDYFEKKGIPSPRVDAELLLSSSLHCQRIDIYTQFEKPVSSEELDVFRPLVERRAKREPLQHILGETEFYGLTMKVTPDVLIPRQETELLVEEIIRTVGGTGRSPLLEIGTGSGCIAIALAKNLPDIQITATDISASALAIAQENALAHGVSDQIDFVECDLFPDEGAASSAPTYDLIVSNPPYIPTDAIDLLQEEVRQDPLKALDGGGDGLDIYRRIAEGLERHLKSGGIFFGEFGDGQEESLQQIFADKQWANACEIILDLSGNPRMIKLQKENK